MPLGMLNELSCKVKPYLLTELCLPDDELNAAVVGALRDAMGADKARHESEFVAGDRLLGSELFSEQPELQSWFHLQ